jgi:hypothetical protein
MPLVAQRTTSTKTKTGRPKTKGASHKPKSSASKASSIREPQKAGEKEVTIDRRRSNRGAVVAAAPPRLERRQKVNRRRQIDPTTCERDYTDDEIQFMNAIEQYKRTSGRMFPTCSEVLEVVRSLGYVKLSSAELAAHSGMDTVPMTNLEVAADEVASAEVWQ